MTHAHTVKIELTTTDQIDEARARAIFAQYLERLERADTVESAEITDLSSRQLGTDVSTDIEQMLSIVDDEEYARIMSILAELRDDTDS